MTIHVATVCSISLNEHGGVGACAASFWSLDAACAHRTRVASYADEPVPKDKT